MVSNLTSLLNEFASTDNAVRKNAEQSFSQLLEEDPAKLLLNLCQLIQSSSDVRNLAAVLVRRMGTKPHHKHENHTYWSVLGEDVRTQCEHELLQALLTEQNPSVRRKLCDTVAELARSMMEKGYVWESLLNAVHHLAASDDAKLRQSSFAIIESLPSLLSGQPREAVVQALLSGLQDANQDVRVQAVGAASAYIIDSESYQGFEPLLLAMLNVLPELVTNTQGALGNALRQLVNLAEVAPKLFRPVFSEIVTFLTSVMKNEDLDEDARNMALELLLTLSENAAPMVRKHPNFVNSVLPPILDMIGQVDDDEKAFLQSEDLDEEDEISILGQQAMDRLALSLGGKFILPVAFNIIPTMLGSPQWQHRYAGLLGISGMAEGCAKVMEGELEKVLNLILPYIKDPNPRVRYAACHTIGQLCSDFAPSIQHKFANKLLPALIEAMQDSELRVKTHAACALVNFSEQAQQPDIAPYVDDIFVQLMGLLNSGKRYAQEQAITTIATIADSGREQFLKYYSTVMPVLVKILQEANDKEYRLLRGKAIECASLIASAVGKDVFGPNAHDFCRLLIQCQESITDPDDPQASYLLPAWARICRVMGQDFVPYLQHTMPPLMETAQIKPDVKILDKDENMEEEYAEEDGWEFVQVDGKNLGIRTTLLEEKATALEMLVAYAAALGTGFKDYAQPSAQIALPLLRFYFSDEVRVAAAELLPLTLKCAVDSHFPPQDVQKMWNEIAVKTVEQIAIEIDHTYLPYLYTCFAESLEHMGQNAVPEPLMDKFVKATIEVMKGYLERVAERQGMLDFEVFNHLASRKDHDFDQEEEEALQQEEETEEDTLAEASRANHAVFKSQGTSYLPYFEQLLPMLDTFIKNSDKAARGFALAFFDDLIEFTGRASWKYSSHFLEPMAMALSDANADIRQSAAYGIGLAGQFGGNDYASVCAMALNPLFNMIQQPKSRDVDNVLATENAIAAVAKICRYNASQIPLQDVIPAWVDTLPILEDESESKEVYSFLLQLLQQAPNQVLGAGMEKVPHVTKALMEALASDVIQDASLTSQVVEAVKSLLATNPSMLNKIIVAIGPEKVSALRNKGISF